MTTFTINLIRERALPRRRRAVLFWSVLAYLLVCGTILSVMAYMVTLRLADSAWQVSALRRKEASFKQMYSAGPEVPVSINRLKADLDGEWMRLTAIDQFLQRRSSVSVVLDGLSQSLPSDLYILNVELDGQKQLMTFDLVIPVGKSIGSPNASELISHWQANQALMREIADIKSLVSERERIGGMHVFLLKFECRLQKRQS